MTVEVIIGCHVDDDDHRRAARDWITGWYGGRGYPITVVEATATPWCKADAYNDPVAASTAEVVVLADADSFVPHTALQWATDQAQRVGWAAPFTRVRRLSQSATATTLATDPATTDRPPATDAEADVHDALPGGGIVVMRRDLAVACGPFDPRFRGYGGEDYALGCAARTLAGDYAAQHPGALWHLWHPRAPGATRNTKALAARYRMAKFDVSATHALIEEWRSEPCRPTPTLSL